MATWPVPPSEDTRARMRLFPVGGANAAVVAVVAPVALTTAGLEASVLMVPPNLVTSRAATPPVWAVLEPAVNGVLAVSVAVLTKVPWPLTESTAVLLAAAAGVVPLLTVTTE
jgi:hypothetical protein